MSDSQVFNLALQFLQRVDLKGSEAMTLAQVQQRLAQLANMPPASGKAQKGAA